MEQFKLFVFFRIHPFIGITIVSVVAIFALGLFFYSAPTAYGIPFGGTVSFYVPSCAPSFVPPPGSNTCTACPLCGVTPACVSVGELVVSGTTYCPTAVPPGLPFINGFPRVGGWILGLGEPLTPHGIIPQVTGVSN